jgi:hypothetical protein
MWSAQDSGVIVDLTKNDNALPPAADDDEAGGVGCRG